jgi:hypothetical protein
LVHFLFSGSWLFLARSLVTLIERVGWLRRRRKPLRVYGWFLADPAGGKI